MQRREMPGNKADGAKMARICEGLAPEGNLLIVERYEDKTDAQQATRLKARMLAHPSGSASPNLPSASLRRISRHFPQIRKHCIRHSTALWSCDTPHTAARHSNTTTHTTKKGNDMKIEIDWLEMAKAVAKAVWPFVAGAFGGLFSGCTFGGIGPIFA